MTFYPAPPRDSYRASTGSMPPSTPTRRSSISHAGSPPSHHDSASSYGGHTPNQSSGSLHPSNTSSHTHRRRPSNAGHEPPPASMSRYYTGGVYVEPAVSHGVERRRRSSMSAPVVPPVASAPRSHAHRSWSSYHHEIEVKEDGSRRGTTRIPRKYVNKEALQQMSLLYEEDRSGALVVLKALPRAEIEHLVELTEYLRAHRSPGHSSSHKREKHVRIITEPTDAVPHPEDMHSHHSRAPKIYSTGPPPSTSGHYYTASSIPRSHGSPRSSIYALSKAEDAAASAEAKARRREYRAESSGGWHDERRALKARHDAEEKARRLEDEVHKDQTKREREIVVVR